jgi:hypothetical protein
MFLLEKELEKMSTWIFTYITENNINLIDRIISTFKWGAGEV